MDNQIREILRQKRIEELACQYRDHSGPDPQPSLTVEMPRDFLEPVDVGFLCDSDPLCVRPLGHGGSHRRKLE